MIKLDISSYNSIKHYIKKTPYGTVYPMSIAEQKQYGDVYTEDDSVLLWHCGGFAFIYGQCSDKFLEQIHKDFLIADNLSKRFMLFTADPNTEQFFRKKDGLVFASRFHYEYPSEISIQLRKLPSEYRICEINRELFTSIEGRVTPDFYWKDSEEFLKHGKGYCMMIENTPVSWAFSAASSNEGIDIGIETAPNYRQKGLGAHVAEQMIRYCFENNKHPIWSCDTANTSSQILAEKLGFIKVSSYTTIKKQ